MDFTSLRVRKLALPIKHHIKKIQIEQKPWKTKIWVRCFFSTTPATLFSLSKESTANGYFIKPFNFFVVALFKYLIQNWMLQLSTNVHSSAFTVIQDLFCQRKNVNVLKIPLDAIVFKFYILYLLLLTPSHFCNGVTWKWHWMHWKSWQALSGWVSGSSTKPRPT